jgi:hypothetical protein
LTTWVGRHAVGERVVGEHQPVAEHVGGDVEDVLGQHVVPAADQRQRTAAAMRPSEARGLAP